MSNLTASESGLEPLMSIDTLSQIIGVPIKTIKDWRLHGEGACCDVTSPACGR
jgi:hypothetical protein